MRNLAEEHVRAASVPPAYLFNLLRAAYGARNAENIFRSNGVSRPGSAVRGVQQFRVACF